MDSRFHGNERGYLHYWILIYDTNNSSYLCKLVLSTLIHKFGDVYNFSAYEGVPHLRFMNHDRAR